MEVLLAGLIGLLYTLGVYMLLRRSLVKSIIGLALLGTATNLLIFVCAGLVRAKPPIIREPFERLPLGTADPLAQALILTAIVISFGVLAFAMVLIKRTYTTFGTDDPDELDKGDDA